MDSFLLVPTQTNQLGGKDPMHLPQLMRAAGDLRVTVKGALSTDKRFYVIKLTVPDGTDLSPIKSITESLDNSDINLSRVRVASGIDTEGSREAIERRIMSWLDGRNLTFDEAF